MFDFEPVARHPAQGVVSGKPGPAPDDGANHSRKKQPIIFEDEPPMDTNEHE